MFTVPEVITIINFVLSSIISMLTAFVSHRLYITHRSLKQSTNNFTEPVGSRSVTPRAIRRPSSSTTRESDTHALELYPQRMEPRKFTAEQR